jgi:hypothetical protein
MLATVLGIEWWACFELSVGYELLKKVGYEFLKKVGMNFSSDIWYETGLPKITVLCYH